MWIVKNQESKSFKASLSESGCFHAESKKIKPSFHESTQIRQKDVQQQQQQNTNIF